MSRAKTAEPIKTFAVLTKTWFELLKMLGVQTLAVITIFGTATSKMQDNLSLGGLIPGPNWRAYSTPPDPIAGGSGWHLLPPPPKMHRVLGLPTDGQTDGH